MRAYLDVLSGAGCQADGFRLDGEGAERRRTFNALADGGQVRMPLDKTFWAEAFGMLTDRFGTPWMVSGGGQAN